MASYGWPGPTIGIHAGIRIDDDLEEGRTLEREEFFDDAWNIGLLVEPHGVLEAVGLRGLDEILRVQRLLGGRQAALEEQLLPLLHHAIAVVVEDHDLHRQVVGGHGLELAEVHAHRGVAVDVDDEFVALRELRADGRGQTEAHGAHGARGEPLARIAEIAVLRGPHLVLADAGGDDGLALRDAVDLFDDVVGLDLLAGAIVVHRVLLLEIREMGQPLGTIALEARAPAMRGQRAQRLGQHAHMAPLHALHLVDLRAVDVEVRDVLRAGRELRGIAGDAIVEARADGDQEVAVVDRVVGERLAVHAQHAHGQYACGVDGADAHERGDHRYIERFRELAQLGGRVAVDDAAAGVDQRALRFTEHLEEVIGLGAVDDVGS